MRVQARPKLCRFSYNLLMHSIRSISTVLLPLLGALSFVELSPAQSVSLPPATYPDLPSETPAKFEPFTDSFDYIKRDVMIPMRDGVKLHTVIIVPKGAKGAPILLTRTPYDAAASPASSKALTWVQSCTATTISRT